MNTMLTRCLLWIGIMTGCIWLSTAVAGAGSAKNMGGWEPGGAYDSHYDATELDYFRANIVKVKTKEPMPGMSPGIVLDVRESKDEEVIQVHVCPIWYMDVKGLGLRRGDRVKIKGVWAEINGNDVFMASKIKRGDHFVLKVRLTSDGTPFWSMSPERLAKEKADD